jgi:hypothetical protein
MLREPDIRMSDDFRDDLQGHTLGAEQRYAGVPQVMKALLRQTGGLHQRVEFLQDLLGKTGGIFPPGSTERALPTKGDIGRIERAQQKQIRKERTRECSLARRRNVFSSPAKEA